MRWSVRVYRHLTYIYIYDSSNGRYPVSIWLKSWLYCDFYQESPVGHREALRVPSLLMGETLPRSIHQFKLHYKLSRYVYDEKKIGGIHNRDDQLLVGTRAIVITRGPLNSAVELSFN